MMHSSVEVGPTRPGIPWLIFLISTLILSGFLPALSYADNLVFEYPGQGKVFTWGEGINNLGQAVGYFLQNCVDRSCNGGAQGFLYSAGVFSSVNDPSARATYANGINDFMQIVGTYANFTTGIDSGFLDNGGSYITIDFPDAFSTSAAGINDAGEIVGTYQQIQGGALVNHGFLDVHGSFSSLTFPGATSTTVTGINNFGAVVGSYTMGSQLAQPFEYAAGNYFPIDVPGMAGATVEATGINDRNDIVGLSNLLGPPQAFIYSDAGLHWVAAPGSYETLAGGINDFGAFVGADYYDDDDVAAYIADPPTTVASEPSSLLLIAVGIVGLVGCPYLRPRRSSRVQSC